MKKVLLSLALSMMIIVAWGQSVPRQYVVTEVATGTWCTYCPGAAMGVDELLENGCFVAVIENHDGDAYANAGSNARNAMYNVSGVPSTTSDGWYGVVGGNHSSSIYYLLRPKYDQRIAEPSNCTVALTVDSTGPYDYHATITVTKVDPIPGTNVVVHFVVTQSHIPQAWQGQTELNFVNRKMVPDENGTLIDFTSGDTQVVELDFSINPAWPKENVEFVAFYQDMDDGQGNMPGTNNPPYGSLLRHQIYQGTKVPGVKLTPDFSADPTVIAPNSYVSFTDLTIGGFLMTPETYHWYFPGATPDTSTMQSPTVQYTTCGKYDVKLVVNKGGQVDSVVKTNYITVGPVITITAAPSNSECWYTPITLSALAPNAASYLWTPGGATTPDITVTAGEYGIGTHTFNVTVTDNSGCVNDKSMDVTFDACVGIPEKVTEPVLNVFPNPNTGTFTVEFNAPAGNYNLKVINPLNVTVYEEGNLQVSGKITKTISLKNAAKGIYYLILQDGSKKAVQKIFVD